ncbi:hypothetical protein ACG83_41300 [Frankia sp. R43]|uniref:hypothetical protein n=1 Tax=Frankia sp. R43 TaxID=269536 RepID=UPI0006CA364D|nr:hypothetical protein [Frankia sp. R43]KPM50258.1 hypothetical protein ACG83_41300 [Frankia sp. R43]
MFSVQVDGRTVDTVDDDHESVTVEIGGDGTTYRCSSCGDALSETSDGRWLGESSGADCPDADPDDAETGGGHVPEAVPLSWCNHAGVTADESEDSVTVHISVGDPCGAFTFTVRRVPDDADSVIAGRLLLHVPYPDAPCGHRPLTALHDGTYLIGS